jgi:hypothetical protein
MTILQSMPRADSRRLASRDWLFEPIGLTANGLVKVPQMMLASLHE